MLTLNIPNQRDPLPRIVLLSLIGVVCFALFLTAANAAQPASAEASTDPIIIIPTPRLPEFTPVPDAPAIGAGIQPTPDAAWFAALPTAIPADQLAAGMPESSPPADAPAAPIDNSQYLANVGAQASHSPRGDSPAPPPNYTAGPVEVSPGVVIDPNPQPPAPGMAVAVPPISQAQADVIAARESNGCAPGQVFYPRSGCHTPGSGGPQPGAVSP